MIKLDTSKLQGTVVLKDTQKIHWENLDTPEQKALAKVYSDLKQIGTSKAMAAASVINMILTQRRIVCCITRQMTGEGIRKDKNHKKGFDNNAYPALIGALTRELGILEVLKKGDGKTPTIFRVKNCDVLKMLTVNEEEQTLEALEFVKLSSQKGDSTDRIPDRKADQGRYEGRKLGIQDCTYRNEMNGNSVREISENQRGKQNKKLQKTWDLVKKDYFPRMLSLDKQCAQLTYGSSERIQLESQWGEIKDTASDMICDCLKKYEASKDFYPVWLSWVQEQIGINLEELYEKKGFI